MLLQFHNWICGGWGGDVDGLYFWWPGPDGSRFSGIPATATTLVFAAFTTYGSFWIALGGIWLNAQLKSLLYRARCGAGFWWYSRC